MSIVDGKGPDIHVFEAGASVEPTILEISKDGNIWINLAHIPGDKVSVDLCGKVSALDPFHHVRLTDVGNRESGPQRFSGTPDADIDADAVAAINAVLR